MLFQSEKNLSEERGKEGKTWVMYKDMNKGKKLIENSSPLYQTYISTVILKIHVRLKGINNVVLTHPPPVLIYTKSGYQLWMKRSRENLSNRVVFTSVNISGQLVCV